MLDRSRPFVTFGYNSEGKKYGQDNKVFNISGNEIKVSLPESEEVDYSGMSWSKVKKLVVENGGVWTNKIDGVEYLRSL